METRAVKVIPALSDIKRLFLDTSPVIYHVEGVAAYQPLTDLIFQHIRDGAVEAVTSTITLTECLVHPYRRNDMRLVQLFRSVITAGVHTRYASVDSVAEPAAELRARYNLGLADAFQVAVALAAGCEGFLTNDAALKRVSEVTVLVLNDLEI